MQLFDVSASGLLETISLWLVFKDFSPLRKDPEDAVMIRGWGMLLAFFPS